MGEFTRATLLSAKPSFLEGVARTLDLAGTLVVYNYSPSTGAADYYAMQADWFAVGDDLRAAMKEYGEEK